MIFQKRSRYNTTKDVNYLKEKLTKSSILVRNQSFFIKPKENFLRIIPDAENNQDLTTLPVTHIRFKSLGNDKTQITLLSKPRRIDAGGPYLLVIFCLFLLVAAAVIYLVDPSRSNFIPVLCLVGLSALVYIIFWFRMRKGYYSYVRGINKEIERIVSL